MKIFNIFKSKVNKVEEKEKTYSFRELLYNIYDTKSLFEFHNTFIKEFKFYVNKHLVVNIHGVDYNYPNTINIVNKVSEISVYNVLKICDELLSKEKLIGEISENDRLVNINKILYEYVKYI